MPRITVTPEDLKRSQILEPDWYPCEVVGYEYSRTKDEKSMNHIYTFKVVHPEDAAGVQLKVWFSEKALGMMREFYEAISGVKVDPKKGFTIDDPNAAVKKRVDVNVINGSYLGRTQNSVNGFRPYSGR